MVQYKFPNLFSGDITNHRDGVIADASILSPNFCFMRAPLRTSDVLTYKQQFEAYSGYLAT